jgi:hypothetical protein
LKTVDELPNATELKRMPLPVAKAESNQVLESSIQSPEADAAGDAEAKLNTEN